MKRDSISTRQRILDSAESLYGSEGLGATSLRAIVKRASVNLNAVNYHFGSKDSVTERLYLGIMADINQERCQLMATLSESPTTRQLIHAAYWPVFSRAMKSEKSKRQIAIVNQVRQDPSDHCRKLVQSSLENFVPEFEKKLADSAGTTRSKLRIPLRLMIASAWGFVSQSMVVDDLTLNKSQRTQQKIFEQFLDYAVAGIDAVLNEDKPR